MLSSGCISQAAAAIIEGVIDLCIQIETAIFIAQRFEWLAWQYHGFSANPLYICLHLVCLFLGWSQSQAVYIQLLCLHIERYLLQF